MSSLREALRDLPDGVFADLLESDDAYLLVVDLPGVDPDGADVAVDGGWVRVDARRSKDVPAGFDYRTEERSLFLDVELPLPPDGTDAGASATLERGVLEVTIPKAGRGGHHIPIEE